jgi:hypothetical protein
MPLARSTAMSKIRWAVGRFWFVEATIYPDAPYSDVPRYFPLALR